MAASILKSTVAILLLALGIQLVKDITSVFSIKSKSVNLQDIYDFSNNIITQESNSTYNLLQKGRLKPASNSYLEAIFPNKTLHLDENGKIPKENATILMLCRNWELADVLKSMRSLEDRFNKDYKYTWTFLNDVDFSQNFIRQTTAMASGETQYATIPESDWDKPDFINETKYDECIKNFTEQNIIYGFSKSYRNMCHFNSGYFYRQPILQNYDYYFRVEPGVEYFCDFQMDPFKLMRENKKKYGFVISILEYEVTIPTLWENVENFLNDNPDVQHKNSAVEFITDQEPIGFTVLDVEYNSAYNLCHFWSNFEIGDLQFFRSEEYAKYFEYLSHAGGFYYERWGDAPVHSIAAALLLDKEEIHNFEDIGYFHNPFQTCPGSLNVRVGKRCICRGEEGEDRTNFDIEPNSCLPRWWKHGSGKKFLREYYHEEDYVN